MVKYYDTQGCFVNIWPMPIAGGVKVKRGVRANSRDTDFSVIFVETFSERLNADLDAKFKYFNMYMIMHFVVELEVKKLLMEDIITFY